MNDATPKLPLITLEVLEGLFKRGVLQAENINESLIDALEKIQLH